MKSINKGFGAVGVLLVILVLVAVGGAGYLVWMRNSEDDTPGRTTNISVSPIATDDSEAGECTAPEGYRTYVNEEVRFCFDYPEGWGDVTLHTGVLDPALETGSGFYGTFAGNENASFAFKSTDWTYTGPGRGGPNYATGFTAYEVFSASPGDTTNYSIKVNTADKQLVGATTMFNFEGVIVWAKRVFTESEPYAGIEFQLNVPATGAFDFEVDEPDDLVSPAQYTEMTTVLDSVREY